MSKKVVAITVSVILLLVICVSLFFSITPSGKAIWNNWFHSVQVADDDTNYDTIKKVEDTCRSMIASYKTDKLTYEQYKDSENKDRQNWAEQAKIRANKTANSYNEYVLKNRYVWKNNVPSDICNELPIVE